MYFEEGYTYKLILCFLAGVHGIVISEDAKEAEFKAKKTTIAKNGNSSWRMFAGKLLAISYHIQCN